MDKVVVLLSGGLDSSVLLYALNEEFEVYPLSLLYGQRHHKEISSAINICTSLGKEIFERHKILDLGILKELLPSTLTGVGEIPEGAYDAPSMSQTVVPGRNLIFLAIAAGYAQGIGAKYVAYAAHAGDHFIYPDCRPEFVKAAAEVLKVGYDIKLLVPFNNINKAAIVRVGSKLGVPFEYSWTCYNGREKHCGKCGSCDERRKAFIEAKVTDPTEYEE